MSAFDDVLAMDGELAFAGGDFSESVLYHSANGDRAISAVVNRNPPRKPDEQADTVTPYLMVCVANSATSGVTLDEYAEGGDRIDLPRFTGGDAETMSIVSIESQDPGVLVLRVR